DGILEIDANPNPLRTELMGPLLRLSEGRASLGDTPGIGVTPDLKALAEMCARGS
ncbi:MAG: Mandelate racemase/muconate lactonizing protein, partial [Ramlibacter sp.]|nr:Mandelate racemase/muconate lactonizing protein [Ramlibacter sp.]